MNCIKKQILVGIISIFVTEYSIANDNLSPYVNDKTPAFATLVIKNDKTVFKSAQGCAVLENGKCITKAELDTPFSICSITKHFTDVGILMLEEEGKLSTNDYIMKYIPNLPSKFKGIKIKHLVFHISGVPNYLAEPGAMDIDQMIKKGKKLTEKEAFTSILKSKPTLYSKTFAYSNSGYVLLAKIIENVSGESYEQFIQHRIFDKFKMKDAFLMVSINEHKNYTEPYSPWPLYRPTNWMRAIILSGEGGIFMSINDFEKWVYAFDHSKIFTKKQTMKKFLSIGKYDNGKDVFMEENYKYGFGLAHHKETKNGKEYNVISHNGGMPGTASEFSNIKGNKNDIWVIYLNNAGSYVSDFDILDQAKIEY